MTRFRSWLKLLAWISVLALTWCVILPLVARTESMTKRLRWLDRKGVDPSAMYYTELEMMQPIFDKLAVKARN